MKAFDNMTEALKEFGVASAQVAKAMSKFDITYPLYNTATQEDTLWDKIKSWFGKGNY